VAEHANALYLRNRRRVNNGALLKAEACMGTEWPLIKCWICKTICGAVYLSGAGSPREPHLLIEERTRHLTYKKVTASRYDFAIAGHRDEIGTIKDLPWL